MSGVKTHDPEDVTAAREGPPCDHPGRCTCFKDGQAAAKRDMHSFISSLDGPPHPQDCTCRDCEFGRTWNLNPADYRR